MARSLAYIQSFNNDAFFIFKFKKFQIMALIAMIFVVNRGVVWAGKKEIQCSIVFGLKKSNRYGIVV